MEDEQGSYHMDSGTSAYHIGVDKKWYPDFPAHRLSTSWQALRDEEKEILEKLPLSKNIVDELHSAFEPSTFTVFYL